jgi:hypothetical protein
VVEDVVITRFLDLVNNALPRRRRARLQPEKAILTYHSIDESGSPISMPAASFEAHRQWFETRRVAVLSTRRDHRAPR